jgi:hypothetical protein
LPPLSTRYLTTDLPRPGSSRAADVPFPPADLSEIVRLYALRNWVEQSYKQAKNDLGWADFQVRTDTVIRRHWVLVGCAFSFCWHDWLRQPPIPGDARVDEHLPVEPLRFSDEHGAIGKKQRPPSSRAPRQRRTSISRGPTRSDGCERGWIRGFSTDAAGARGRARPRHRRSRRSYALSGWASHSTSISASNKLPLDMYQPRPRPRAIVTTPVGFACRHRRFRPAHSCLVVIPDGTSCARSA